MEYFQESDLTKHIGVPLLQETVQNISMQVLEGLKVMHEQGVAHRDIKIPIFVASMSPVWVKLGDFGVSKRILAQATTTFHTRCQPLSYGAPEVLGLNSNSESSGYTNPVDIWSVGCVIYELLVGQNLFSSWDKITPYYFEKRPFPRDGLRLLSLYWAMREFLYSTLCSQYNLEITIQRRKH
ncbi:kinase-like domain-containing protein [Tuber borchii]|uniref:Kinase-like domain-containing protein n=1 Tax=Tuber borchii TaxID=42251 RepID=A0A2T6ZU38_TUBBO|nr:kinase-like domain-containing protein [Tuber borchii]